MPKTEREALAELLAAKQVPGWAQAAVTDGFFPKEQGWDYSSILPFRHRQQPAQPYMGMNESGQMQQFTPPQTEFALPDIVRHPLQRMAEMLTIPGAAYQGLIPESKMPEAANRFTEGIMYAGQLAPRPANSLATGTAKQRTPRDMVRPIEDAKKALSDAGLHVSAKHAGTGSAYITVKQPSGGGSEYTVRISSHGKRLFENNDDYFRPRLAPLIEGRSGNEFTVNSNGESAEESLKSAVASIIAEVRGAQ